MKNIEIVIDALSGSIHKVIDMIPKNPSTRYIQVRIGTEVKYVHHLIWESVHGAVPDGLEIDHIDGNRYNNSILNLRLIQHDQNCQNRQKAHIQSKSGVKGVHYDKANKKWVAVIGRNGKRIFLGRFDNIEEAKIAYAKGAAIHHTHNPHAEVQK